MNDAMKKYHRDWYHAHRDVERKRRKARLQKHRRLVARMIADIKLILGCNKCGYRVSPYALDFHHRDATTKKFDVASYSSRHVLAVLAEIAKCDVICSNCHRVLTHEEKISIGV